MTMPLEDYVASVVASEMPLSWPQAALQAQACAARTYALATAKHRADGFDVCDDSGCCQAYHATSDARAIEAAQSTKGVVGTRDGVIMTTYYAACCGGRTLNGWGTWLKARYCPCSLQGRQTEQRGHRNGMCQWGSQYLAAAGWDWRAILDYYYDLTWEAMTGDGK